MKLQEKKIALLGLGEENLALLDFLVKKNISFSVGDRNEKLEKEKYQKRAQGKIENFYLGKNYLKNLDKFDLVFRTPGIPYLTKELQDFEKSGREVSSQTKLFFESCPAKIIGVTGTKGKGTTSTLIYEILKEAFKYENREVYLGGNIGMPPISFLEKLTLRDWVVLELSSFQLQDLDISPHIALVLNIASDHLDYHQDEREYLEAKYAIVKYQRKGDMAVINADYLTSFKFAELTPAKVFWLSKRKSVDQGGWFDRKELVFKIGDVEERLNRGVSPLRGEHNTENILAAGVAALLAGASFKNLVTGVKNFKGLPHRLEEVAKIKGVLYVNDSFATTPETTIAAIKSFSEPLILIVGGSEKNADYTELGEIIAKTSNVKRVIGIGTTGPKILKAIEKFKNKGLKLEYMKGEMKDFVKAAAKESTAGDVILLSPASASLDMFKNYKERGEAFKKAVNGKV